MAILESWASLQLHANCGVHSGLQGNFCKYHELARHDPANREENQAPAVMSCGPPVALLLCRRRRGEDTKDGSGVAKPRPSE